eukprot:77444-Chlamydomonas_euryale.AAC.2
MRWGALVTAQHPAVVGLSEQNRARILAWPVEQLRLTRLKLAEASATATLPARMRRVLQHQSPFKWLSDHRFCLGEARRRSCALA